MDRLIDHKLITTIVVFVVIDNEGRILPRALSVVLIAEDMSGLNGPRPRSRSVHVHFTFEMTRI